MPVAMPPGSIARPVSVGVKRRIPCANIGNRITPPYSPKPSAMKRKIDAASVRLCRTRRSTTGCSFRLLSSHQTIATRHAPERMASRRMSTLANQSFAFPSSSTYCIPPTPTVSSTIPVQSTGVRTRPTFGGSCRKVLTRNSDAAPIGMLMKKHQFHV